MADGIDGVRALLGAKARPVGWAERRARLDEVASVDPPALDLEFTPARIGPLPAEWSLAPGSDPARVLLYFHGGGYCSGSILSHRGMVGAAGRAAGVRTLAIGYRLAPEHPFPAALDDALDAYRFLLAEGYPPGWIALGGDSAGGNLLLACMLRLRTEGLPLPGCGWLVSPWIDLRMTGESLDDKAAVDPLIQRDYLHGLAQAFLAGHDPDDPLISALHADLSGLPPMLVQVGSAETLLDDAVRVARALGAADVEVRLEIWPHMIHAWHLWAARLAEGKAAIAAAGGFIATRLQAAPSETLTETGGR
ncbi:alpha/beta hydrolase [Geminicoccus flavidas]|uniref:alpha/beta hydrolase n=1 Tax=Geminicoccus flavidas TaxID=2506407 RepID=UPI001356FAEA|nr:alpha/beta hydrolase [Geminicoccus flavidas]